jgi:hypothetical protein
VCDHSPLRNLKRPALEDDTHPRSCSWGALRFPHVRAELETELQPKPARWAAIGEDSSMDDVSALLTTTWGLRWPKVIISVTGAAGKFPESFNEDAREAFQLGLLGAVRSTNAWIVTGGTDGGAAAQRPKPSSRSQG